MKSKLAKRLASVAVGLFVSLLMLEVLVRFIEPRKILRSDFQTPDDVLHHKFIPGAHAHYRSMEFMTAYDINSLGLRDRELSLDKPSGVRRVLVVGDSFTEGIGVEASETFSSLLQKKLDADGFGKRWQVINAGVASYSPLLEYLYLEHDGLKLDPDLVLLVFDLSDVLDDIQYTALARFDSDGKPLGVSPEPERINPSWPVQTAIAVKDFFKENTRLYNFLRRNISALTARPDTDSFTGEIRTDKYAMTRDGYQPKKQDWELTHKYVLMIRDLLRERGIDLLMTLHPYGHQVSGREWSEGRLFWGFEKGRVYSTKGQELMERFARDNGIPVVNMCDAFKRASRDQFPLYLEHDGHWRAAGHKVAANALYRALLPYVRDGKLPDSGAAGAAATAPSVASAPDNSSN